VFNLSFVARRVASALAGLSLATALAPAVIAAPPPSPTLNPEPPDIYTCQDNGGGSTICRAHTSQDYGPDPTGIFCGSGAGAFEVLDSATRVIDATRYYDRDGNIVRRRRVVDFINPHYSNPLTGALVPYTQRNPDWETFTVPGDLSSAIYYAHGMLQFTVPGMGTVLHESGTAVFVGDLGGELLHSGGPMELSDYYAGDTSLVADLCKALGA
jgi:hypothetical protein